MTNNESGLAQWHDLLAHLGRLDEETQRIRAIVERQAAEDAELVCPACRETSAGPLEVPAAIIASESPSPRSPGIFTPIYGPGSMGYAQSLADLGDPKTIQGIRNKVVAYVTPDTVKEVICAYLEMEFK